MKRILTALVVVALTAAAPTIAAARATHPPTICSGTLSGVTLDGGVIVTGGSCILDGVTVNGGVFMSSGRLQICDSIVNGPVDVTGGSCVTIAGVELGEPGCSASTINGHLNIENVDNDSRTRCPFFADVKIFNASIGRVDLNNNDVVEVGGSVIHGVLSCEGNSSITNGTFPNIVTGQEKGQCAGL
jgi:hypothetical protein